MRAHNYLLHHEHLNHKAKNGERKQHSRQQLGLACVIMCKSKQAAPLKSNNNACRISKDFPQNSKTITNMNTIDHPGKKRKATSIVTSIKHYAQKKASAKQATQHEAQHSTAQHSQAKPS